MPTNRHTEMPETASLAKNTEPTKTRLDLRIALAYAFFGGIWILFTDSLLHRLVHDQDHDLFARAQIYKDLAFVFLGAIFLFQILRRELTLRDIAEERLGETQRRFHTAFDDLLEGVQIIDRDWRYVYINETAASHGHSARDVLIGRTMMEMYPGIETTEMFAALRDCMENRQSHQMENEFTYPDGSQGWFNLSVQPVMDGLLILSFDITERKQAEENLRQSEARFSTIFHASPIGVNLFRLSDGKSVDVNEAFLELTGYEREELIGHSAAELNLFTNMKARAGWMETLLAKKAVKNVDAQICRKSGEFREALASIDMLEIEGEQMGLVIVADITDRKRADASLRLQSAALEVVANGVVITNRAGSIQWANAAYTKLTGYPLDEIRGKNARIVNSGLQDKAFYKTMWDTILSGQAWHGELINKRKDGSLYNDEMTITPLIAENGQITHFIGIKQDVTERKKAEAEIRQRVRELEMVNRISIALRASTNQEQALAVMLEEVLNVFDTRNGVISLWDMETERLKQVIARGWLAGITERPIRSGEGIFGTVFAEGEPHRSVEFASDPLVSPHSLSQLPVGWGGACVPIRSNEKILGVLTLAVPSRRIFHHEEVRLLETLAEIAGTALHRMSLNEEVRRHLERLQSLRQIDAAIAGSFDRRTTLETILAQVIAQLGVSAAAILMLDAKMHTLYLGAHQGFTAALHEATHILVGEGFAGVSFSEKRMVNADLQAVRRVPKFYQLWQREGFSSYYAVPLIVKDRPIGVLEIYQRTMSTPNKEWFNFLEALAGQAAIALENAELFENLETANAELTHAYDATIEGWSHAMDLRDKETEGHTQRVTALTLKLARAMGASPAELVHIRRGALLHDIGKMGIPDRILLKPDKLTDEEWEMMRKHPTFALEMLESIGYLRPALTIPYCHHERWDGSGYPRGLVGNEIPIEARIFAVVDVWDAVTSDRPYRPAWPKEKALDYINEQSGKQFDPDVVYIFLRLSDEEREIGLQSGA